MGIKYSETTDLVYGDFGLSKHDNRTDSPSELVWILAYMLMYAVMISEEISCFPEAH